MAKQAWAVLLLLVLMALHQFGCKADCPSLGDIANGQISYSSSASASNEYPFLTVGSHTCNGGFVLTGGVELRVCLSDGSWSSGIPSCLPSSSTCASLVVPTNGQISYATDMDPEFDGETIATYSCIEGFGLKGGDVVRTCEGSPIGTWSGNAPTCEAIICLDIPDPVNGQIIFDPDTHSPFLFGTVASYSCFVDGENGIGYGLTGGNHTRTCDGDGSHYIGNWTGTAPTCETILCPELEPPENGTITSINLNFRMRVYYSCNTGFGLSAGSSNRWCLGSDRSPIGYWNGAPAVCTAVVCASLGNFANGNITYVDDTIPDHDFATIATYTCNDGYRLRADYSVVESLVRTCAKLYYWRSTGFWSPNPRYHQPYCEYTRCSSLPVPTNGRPIVYAPDTTEDFDTGTTATYGCMEGFAFSGGNVVETCNIRAWHGSAPRCEAIMCLDLPNPLNGRIDFSIDETAFFDYSTNATYVCDIGYGLTDEGAVRICGGDETSTTGVWSGDSPTCEAIMCPELTDPANGRIIFATDTAPTYEFATTATYICDLEYGLLEGNGIRTCGGDGSSYRGTWDGDVPVCEPIMCLELTAPANGQIEYNTDQTPDFDFGTVATYHCDRGYGISGGNGVRMCGGDVSSFVGLWSGIDPSCEPVFCPGLADPLNGDVAYSTELDERGNYPFGTTATYSCDTGYGQRDGIVVRMCDSDGSSEVGSFKGGAGVCEDIKCADIPVPENGMTLYSVSSDADGKYGFGATVSYECIRGFGLVPGLTVRTCGGNGSSIIGSFDETAPTCETIACSLSDPLNGYITYSVGPDVDGNFTFGTTAAYTCDTGFSLVPLATVRTCDGEGSTVIGSFDGNEPTCEGIVCPRLNDDPTNGVIMYSNEADGNGNYPFSTSATYICIEGYGLVEGVSARMCAGDGSSAIGSFVGNSSTCAEITCPAVPILENGERILYSEDPLENGNFAFDVEILYRCFNDYTLQGVTTRHCDGDGTSVIGSFDGMAPMCDLIVTCAALLAPVNGTVEYNLPRLNIEGRLDYDEGTIATFSCETGYYLNGVTESICTSVEVVVGIWSEISPFCEAIMCPALTSPSNGVIVYASDTSADFDFGTTATFSCNPGFGMVGGDEVRTCGGDGSSATGTWTGNQTVCELMCPSLLELVNGQITYSADTTPDFDVGTTATHACDRGYGLTEDAVRICTASADNSMASWSGNVPSCTTIICEELTYPENGVIAYVSDTVNEFVFGTLAVYTCNEGFGLNGSDAFRTCDGDGSSLTGSFDGSAPICDPITCAPLSIPSNGQVIYSTAAGPGFELDTMVTYSCEGGFSLVGGDEMRTCGGVSSSSQGVWSGNEPSCQVIMCPDLMDPDNGRVTYSPDVLALFDFGTVATYQCDSGYALSGEDTRTCEGDGGFFMGTWSGVAPICEIIQCSEVVPVVNGTVSYSSSISLSSTFDFGTTVTYSCGSGFAVSGNVKRTCRDDSSGLNGEWDGNEPTCVAIQCPALAVPENGQIVYTADMTPDHDHGTTATYSCTEGFGLSGGDTVRTCSGDGSAVAGEWNGSAPSCELLQCLALAHPDNGRITYATDRTPNFDYGTNATYSCDSSFGLSGGDAIRTCGGDGSSPSGQWSGNAPTCEGNILCPSLPDPLNGQIVYSTHTTGDQMFGATATYVCDSGFGLSGGERVRACSSDGSSTTGFWTESAPSCLAEIMCQALSPPGNGQITYSTTVTLEATFNTTVTYSCDIGFGLSGGDRVRTCEGDGISLEGMWTGDAPTCEAIACEDLPDPSNGEINFSLDKTAPFEFETTATYSCDPGFGISGGDPVRTCGGDGSSPSGEWTGNASTCEGNIMCPSLPDPLNGQIVYSTNTTGDQMFGATATYICDSSFGLSGGERVRACSSDGSSTIGFWTGRAPSCLGEITCQVLSAPEDGQITYSPTVASEAVYGTIVTYSCDVGFGLSGGDEERTCEGDGYSLEGLWNGSASTCEAITCEDLLNPPNGEVNFSPDKTAPFDFGTNATYSCGTGFGLSEGNAMRTCDGDGSSPMGEWDGTAPTCEGNIMCPSLPDPLNGQIVYSTNTTGDQVFGATATFVCDSGFGLSGGKRVTACSSDGSSTIGFWTESAPSCLAEITCQVLSAPEDGQITYSPTVVSEAVYGTIVIYSCDVGFGLSGGGEERTCEGDGNSLEGMWNGSASTCEAITCEDLLNPPNGDVNFSPDKTAPFDFGTNATYSCGTGFGLSEGNAMRTCDGDGSSPMGEWDGTAPTCEGNIMCPSLPYPLSGQIVYSTNTTGDQVFGATATYVCDSGFGLSGGERVRACSSDGSSTIGFWTESAPSCLAEITCQVLSAPEDGQITYSPTVASEAVYGTIVTYSCDVGFGLSGGDEERICEGDGNSLEGMWNGSASTCEAITCEDLLNPPNGEVNFSPDKTAPFDFGTNATYSCDTGFGLSEGNAMRTCDSDGSSPIGEWDGTAPICEGNIMCPSLPYPLNGQIVYSTNTTGDQVFGATATYVCDSGFGLSGGERVTACSSDGSSTTGFWTESAPSCLAEIICQVLSAPEDGQITYSPTVVSEAVYGTIVTYSCDVGFGLSGGDVERTCEGDGNSLEGMWNGSSSTCEAITCEDLLNPPNGDVNFSPDKTAPFDFGTNATYSCGTGFGLSEGNAMRTCDGDGSSPIGEWDGTAPTCEGNIMCPILPDPLNGQIVYSTNTTGEQVFGATSTYVCDSGFGLSGGERVRACSSDSSSTIGFWTGSAPSCLGEITCQVLSAPEDGQITYSATVVSEAVYGTIVTYSCDVGFGLSGGDEERTCEGDGNSLEGVWNGSASTCEAITCEDLLNPPNGEVNFSPDKTAPFDFGTNATYSCGTGFGLSEGNAMRTCDGDGSSPTGEWDGTAPTCEGNIMCPSLPDPLNGQIVYSTNTTGDQVFGATATYVCDSGFGLSGGERVRACSSDGSSTIGFWTESAPSCLAEITCQVLSAPEDGQITYSPTVVSEALYGTIVTYSCDVGFGLSGGDEERTCEGDGNSLEGMWNGVSPTCKAIVCEHLPDPIHGDISFYTDTTAPFEFGTNATYKCDSGFGLSGDGAIRTCDGDGSNPNGEWSENAPTCEPIICSSLAAPSNGDIIGMTDGLYEIETMVVYSCHSGYGLSGGNMIRTCDGDGSSEEGTWSGEAPLCEAITCPSLTPPLNGQVMYTTNSTTDLDFGTVATYTCNTGFGLRGGDVPRMCDGDSSSPIGSWTGTAPSCTRIVCSTLTHPTEGQISYSGNAGPIFEFGTTATYTCNTGLGLSGGNETRDCVGEGSSPNGYWTGSMPSCGPIRCPPLFGLLNGQIQYNEDSTSDFRYETVATYECAIGFALIRGDSSRACIGDGRETVGTWSGSAPTCDAIACQRLEEPLNGQIVYNTNSSASSYEFGTIATYICDTSYVLSVNLKPRVCRGDSIQGLWNGNTPICKFTRLQEGVDYIPFIDVMKDDGVTLYELIDKFGCSELVYMSIGLPLGSKTETRLRVCSNGVISFGPSNFYFSYPELFPSEHPSIRATNVIAPFWNDHDARSQGDIVYKVYMQNSGKEAGEYLDLVSSYVSRQHSTNFTGSWMLVAYWDRIPPYGSYDRRYNFDSGQVTQNSYQGIVITDDIQTYAVFTYNCEMLQWTTPPLSNRHSVIGYNLNTDFSQSTSIPTFQNHRLSTLPEVSTIACANKAENVAWSNIIYKIGESNSGLQLARAECLRLLDRDIKNFQVHNPYMLSSSPCPCSVFQAFRDTRYMYISDINQHTTAVAIPNLCFTQRFPPRSINYGTNLCCYSYSFDNFGALLDNSFGVDGSSLLRYHPYWHFSQFVEYDYKFQQTCCGEANLCEEYTKLRPSDSCRRYFPLKYSWSRGDPHITTLDGRVYTFNGWGEYILLNVDNGNTSFTLQGRTQPFVNSSATQFSAFAFGVPQISVVEVQLNEMTKEMSVFLNSMEITPNVSIVNETFNTLEVTVLRGRNNSFTFSFLCGIGLTTTVSSGILSVVLTVPEDLNGTTQGLLGNFNGNIIDDFMYPNGTVLTDGASDREIHDFGQSWEILLDDSLFVYPDGLGPGNFSHPDHIPAFLDEVVANASPEVLAACGNNTECIFDASQTGDISIGLETMAIDDNSKKDQAIAANNPPRITGPTTLFIRLGVEAELTFNVTDDNNNYNVTVLGGLPDNSTLSLKSNDADGVMEYVFKWHLLELVNESLLFEARDDFDAVSVLNVQLQICACENDGNCTTDGLFSISGSSILLNCQCPEAWEGDFCTEDVDGCGEILCFEGVECIDVPAPGVGAMCGPCPDGFIKDGEKCQDLDECLNGTDNCQHICVNTEGSFDCECQIGYILKNFTYCEDIDECSMLNGNCHHTCTNKEGSFICSCYDGYELLNDNSTCQALESYSCGNATNCTHNCIHVFGEDMCSCDLGYELDADNVTCTNIDECLQQPCDQVCNDTDGGFECSCNDGYELAMDEAKCNDINECSVAALNGTEICMPPMFCNNLAGSYRCECPGGTILTNGVCLEIETVTMPPPTTSLSPTTPSNTLSPEIEANAVQMTLPGFTSDAFVTGIQRQFKETTAVAVNTYCAESSDKCAVSRVRERRQVDAVGPDDIILTDITDNEQGQLTFTMHIQVNNGTGVLSASTLQESIEDARDEYITAGFSDISVNPLIPSTTEVPSVISVPGLTNSQTVGVVVGAVVAAVIIVLIVIVMLCYLKYRSGHSKNVHLQSHSLEYTNPVADDLNEIEDKANLDENKEDEEKEIELATTLNIYVDLRDKTMEDKHPSQNESGGVIVVSDPILYSPIQLETESEKALVQSD